MRCLSSSHQLSRLTKSSMKTCNLRLAGIMCFLGVCQKNIRVNSSEQAFTVGFVGSEKFRGR